MIPIGFLKTSSIDCSNTPLNTIDRDLIWRQPYNRPMLQMSLVSSDIVPLLESGPEDPCWGDRRGEMCIGYFGQWRDEGRVNDVLAQSEKQ
jgi:hypothetical protein